MGRLCLFEAVGRSAQVACLCTGTRAACCQAPTRLFPTLGIKRVGKTVTNFPQCKQGFSNWECTSNGRQRMGNIDAWNSTLSSRIAAFHGIRLNTNLCGMSLYLGYYM